MPKCNLLFFRYVRDGWCELMEDMVRKPGSFNVAFVKYWCEFWEDLALLRALYFE